MRLVSFLAGNRPGFGVLDGDRIVDLGAAGDRYRERGLAAPTSMLELLRLGPEGLDVATATVADGPVRTLGDVVLRAPIPHPDQIVAIGRNYVRPGRDRSDAPGSPRIFPKWSSTVIGPGEAIVRPAATRKLDWEVELAVVIGRTARRVARKDALAYVAGYTIINDVSARDIQNQQPEQLAMAKNFRTFTPMGAAIVTADEVPDPGALDIRCWVNGELMQDSNTRHLIFDVPELVSRLSHVLDLHPGDLISTGTPPGTGNGRTPPRYLGPGDVVRMQLGDLVELVNPVVDEAVA
ncbi:MAG TPA: fumarylacetoacetate hydrolase family protein [Mycobacteriales bacterium]|jgi:2-keto-4-pentenoate hydratase/2-oxohepta-3-ene-1,7-dioic acid hydratase in catechol pathway|nr:fumarylacetoacetate hydrolase family protein [Mycobacteriales bacterium]